MPNPKFSTEDKVVISLREIKIIRIMKKMTTQKVTIYTIK